MKCYTKIHHKPRHKAELRLVVKVGSLHENDSQLGIAHFIEHLAFRQTAHHKDGEIIKYLERFGMAFGADLNASTSFDETNYQLTVPLDKEGLLEEAVGILADWARGVEPTAKALSSEKKIVLEEWREGQSSRQRLANKLFAAKLEGSRYPLRLPIGSPELIKQFTIAQCLEFYNQWYRPECMAFIAVGDFTNFAQVERLADKFLAPLTVHPSFPLTPSLPDSSVRVKPGKNFLIQTDPEATKCSVSVSTMRPYVQLSPLADIKDEMLTTFAVNILNSRLSKLIRRPNPAFISAACDVHRYVKPVQTTLIEADCGADAATIIPSLEALMQEVYRFVSHGISERELRTCVEDRKSSFESTLLERHDLGSEDLVEDCLADFIDNEPILGVEYTSRWGLAILKSPAISVESVSAKVRELFDLSTNMFCHAVTVGDNSQAITKAKLKSTLTRVEKAQGNLEPWADDLVSELVNSAATEVDLSLLLAKHDLPSLGAVELVFRNGLRAVLKQTDFEQDSVYLKGFALRGTAQYSQTRLSYLEATVACPVAMETGCGPYPKDQLDEIFAGKLATTSLDLTRDSRRVEGESSVTDFECLLQMLELLFTQQKVTARAWDHLKRRCHQQLVHREKNPLFHFQRRLSELTTQGHHFYQSVRAEDLDAMDFERIRRIFFESFSDLSQLLFVLTGNIPPLEQSIPLLIRYLGSLSKTPLPPDCIPIQLRPLKTVVPEFPKGIVKDVIYFGLAPRAQVGLVFPVTCPDHESVIVVLICEILNNVLISRLRRQLGGVYTCSVSTHKYSLLSLVATVTILFSCDPSGADGLADAVLETMAQLRALPPDKLVIATPTIPATTTTIPPTTVATTATATTTITTPTKTTKKATATPSTTTTTTTMPLRRSARQASANAEQKLDSNPPQQKAKRRKVKDSAPAKEDTKEDKEEVEGEEEEDLGKIFVQAFQAVVANQRSNYRTSQRENSYWEDLIYNGCLMYHPEKGANLQYPFHVDVKQEENSVTADSKQELGSVTMCTQHEKNSSAATIDTKEKDSATTENPLPTNTTTTTLIPTTQGDEQQQQQQERARLLDAILRARHQHVLQVLDQLSLQSCQAALQSLLPLDNYVLLKLLPAKLKANTSRKRPRRGN